MSRRLSPSFPPIKVVYAIAFLLPNTVVLLRFEEIVEGIKFLNTWLEGERLIGFCKYLGKNIQSLNQMKFLTCASLEISSSSKRRLPKLIYAKTLRIVVQQAEDDKILNDANMVHSYDGLLWTLRSLQELSSVLLLPDPKLKKLSDSSPSNELSWLSMEWSSILERTQLHRNLLEPFIAFRRVLLQISSCRDCATSSAGSRFSQAAAALHEFKWLSVESGLEGHPLQKLEVYTGKLLFHGSLKKQSFCVAKVMQQFFGLVNTFLQNHQDTWKRRLGVRTYKVVPFTPSAGVLEWVNGTLPLGEYLTGRPVMHHFFLERFLQPADWFETRLSYTRSVAASSMVGYIVGLGDRHSMNILIDQMTAEVVHIDLGVAFEQGLMLKTPERVCTLLTRDVIDGMGVTGVEGFFRRCCEETLSVMRTNKEALLTIVEETDDDLNLSFEGSQDEYEGNKDAAHALMRVKQKLDGYEEGKCEAYMDR
ncbi:hypothetical protein DVH24_039604 [Malus domestica]|uniref:PI3K/PI4K catalytic domain-containing protein n=1 Tax=Malus domestica TaxID=3750 RepID=A0A498I972_MALDO|nr:hypothetical protein DVH24_039604 [Malus domestica]